MSWYGQARKGDNVYLVINDITNKVTVFSSKMKSNDYVKFLVKNLNIYTLQKCSKTGLVSAYKAGVPKIKNIALVVE